MLFLERFYFFIEKIVLCVRFINKGTTLVYVIFFYSDNGLFKDGKTLELHINQ